MNTVKILHLMVIEKHFIYLIKNLKYGLFFNFKCTIREIMVVATFWKLNGTITEETKIKCA